MNTTLRETVTLNKNIEIEGNLVVRMSAQIYSDVNNEMSYNVAVSNYELYMDNIEQCRAEIDNFYTLVKKREDTVIDMYHEEAPEEETEVEA